MKATAKQQGAKWAEDNLDKEEKHRIKSLSDIEINMLKNLHRTETKDAVETRLYMVITGSEHSIQASTLFSKCKGLYQGPEWPDYLEGAIESCLR